jgi:2-methylisocitrate lyase-like PEP mutase family enzyme
MRSQRELAEAFRALHESPGAFIIPNPWDVGSARVLAGMGFPALATTSSGFAYSVGKRDNTVSFDDSLAHVRALVDAVDVPVSADLAKAFGDTPEAVAATFQAAVGLGLAGASIEDASGDPGAPIYDFGLAVERVRAAAAVTHALPFPFMLTARAENFLHGRRDLADTIARLQAFQDAGADVLYAPGLATEEEIRAVVSAVDRPVNVLVGMPGMSFDLAALAAMGVKRVSVGGGLARAAIGALLRAAREMHEDGSFGFLADAASFRDVSAWLDASWRRRQARARRRGVRRYRGRSFVMSSTPLTARGWR